MSFPALPGSIALLPPSLSGLATAGPAGAGTFRVEGARVRGGGAQRDDLAYVDIDGIRVLSGLNAGRGSAVNVLAFPGMVRRELAGPTGICLETLVAAPTLPFAAVQWSGGDGAAPVEISFTLPGAPANVRVEAERGVVVHALDDGRIVAVGISPHGNPQVTGSESDRVHVRVTGLGSTPTTLVVACGTPAQVAAAFAASAHLSGHARRAASSPVSEGLTIATGVAEIDDGVAWALARVRGMMDHAPGPAAMEPDRLLVAGLAGIAGGDREGTARLLSRPTGEGSTIYGLLAARFSLATGSAEPASRFARAWTDPDAPASDDPLGLTRLARRMLGDGLRHGASEALIAELGRPPGPTQGPLATMPSETTSARRLPVVGPRGKAEPVGWASWLEGLLGGDPLGPAPASTLVDVDISRRACHDFRDAPDAAWSAWRNVLASGISDGRLGCWGPGDHESDSDAIAAELILALAHGLLGYSPDAPVGRVRLAPRLPSHLTAFSASGLSVGDASLTLHYARSGRVHTFTLEPSLAAVPPLAVFEPAIRGTVRSVRIDGESVDLDSTQTGSRTVVPVQIPIDGPRTIEIEVE